MTPNTIFGCVKNDFLLYNPKLVFFTEFNLVISLWSSLDLAISITIAVCAGGGAGQVQLGAGQAGPARPRDHARPGHEEP